MSKYDRIPKPLRNRAKLEVAIFGALFTDTAMELAAEGINVNAYEHRLLDRIDPDYLNPPQS